MEKGEKGPLKKKSSYKSTIKLRRKEREGKKICSTCVTKVRVSTSHTFDGLEVEGKEQNKTPTRTTKMRHRQ